MRDRFYARDAAYDGRFITGVVTTGIYCLPSCPARKPKVENIRFFEGPESARDAGFRACRRCRPDDYYDGADPDGDAIAGVAQAAADQPGAFRTVRDLAHRLGMGTTRLTAAWRRHYHDSPATWLAARRVARACHDLLDGRAPLQVGTNVGFESSSAFHESFKRHTGMTPGQYARLRSSTSFVIALPVGYRVDATLAYLVRDEGGVGETLQGRSFTKAVLLPGGPVTIACRVTDRQVRVDVHARRSLAPEDMVAAHDCATRLFAIGVDPKPFERLVRRRGHSALIRGRSGLRIPRTATLFEGLVWTVVGQQVNLAFAHALRRDLIQLCGRRAPMGLLAHPGPEDIAKLDPSDLHGLRFTRRKSEYLVDLSRAIVEGSLSLDATAVETAPRLHEKLLGLRGIGPWSAAYLMMRGFGFSDCVPVGDAALVAALQRWYGLDARPDAEGTRALMKEFAPYRSFATFHLWQSLKDRREEDA